MRPWVCSSVFSVSPPEWCNPSNKQNPKIFWTRLQPIDIPFYDKKASITLPDLNMPDTVYRILVGGFRFLSDIPSLEYIWQEIMQDEEIRRFVMKVNKYG